MTSSVVQKFVLVLLVVVTVLGCKVNNKVSTSFSPCDTMLPTLGESYLEISEPSLQLDCEDPTLYSASPVQVIDYQNVEYRPMTLDECIRVALESSEVFRDLSGTIVSAPNGIATALDPAMRFTDPRFGEDSALSAFDTNFVSSLNSANNDRPFNNRFSGDSNGLLVQDLSQFSVELNKLSATGTQFTAKTGINYDNNNQAGNRYGHAWEALVEGGFRHPLLQGSGSMFNRIAGPSQTPGVYNGILIARTNTEISLSSFEASVRDFVSNVENAYWDLYYAYRELDAQIDARDAASIVLKNTTAQAEEERISALSKASAEEQYLRFETAIIESLEGRLIEGTQARSGSSGGSFRRTVGVRVAERKLRYLIGMSITDGVLLQPSDLPLKAPVTFDWDDSVATAISMRPEVRRQRWVVKQKELELTAAKNFLMPRLDLVGNYRFRGLGKSLTGGSVGLNDDIADATLGPFQGNSSATSDLFSGDFQEVQMGAELRMPVGFRRGHAAVRNAELGVQRERTVLTEQERKIMLDLSNAVAETRRAFSAMSIAERRFNAALEYRKQATEAFTRGRSQFDVVLEAQRRVLESQLQFINAEVEYAIAIKNVHFEKGTFLQYSGIALSESQSSPKAYLDYNRRIANRKSTFNYVMRDEAIARPKISQSGGLTGLTGPEGFSPIEVLPEVGLPVGNGFEAPIFAPVEGVPITSTFELTDPPIPTGNRQSVSAPNANGFQQESLGYQVIPLAPVKSLPPQAPSNSPIPTNGSPANWTPLSPQYGGAPVGTPLSWSDAKPIGQEMVERNRSSEPKPKLASDIGSNNNSYTTQWVPPSPAIGNSGNSVRKSAALSFSDGPALPASAANIRFADGQPSTSATSSRRNSVLETKLPMSFGDELPVNSANLNFGDEAQVSYANPNRPSTPAETMSFSDGQSGRQGDRTIRFADGEAAWGPGKK